MRLLLSHNLPLGSGLKNRRQYTFGGFSSVLGMDNTTAILLPKVCNQLVKGRMCK